MRRRLFTCAPIALTGAFALAGCSTDGGESGPVQADASASMGQDSAIEAPPTQDASTTMEAALPPNILWDASLSADASAMFGADSATAIDAWIGIEPSTSDDAAEEGSVALSNPDGSDCAVGVAGEPLDLKCTGLYSNWESKTISPDAHPYTPGLTLWSDGATKNRWIALPSGQTIDTSNMDEWQFPVGTKIWKEFILGGTPIETRLLWKTADFTWYMTTYLWSADQQSAVELVNGKLNADGNGYEVPDQAACSGCHTGREDNVLGFEAVSLAAPAATGMTLQVLKADHRLSAPPAKALVVPGTPVEAAALGYLHANCGTACHNPDTTTRNKGFYMRLDVSTLGAVKDTEAWTTGWNVPAADAVIAGAATRFAACNTDGSAVFFRMDHRDGVNDAGTMVQMPPDDTHKIDDAGVAAIAAWINEGCADAGKQR